MRYLLRRIGLYLVTAWAAITLNFLIPRLMPGDPGEVLLAKFHGRLDPRSLQAIELAFGISHASLWTQYLGYLNDLAHGNLGVSLNYFPTPVIDVLAQSLPWTLALFGFATIFSFALGTLLGILAAWKRGSRLDSFLSPVATTFQAIPYFWLALLVVYVFGAILRWFPLSGAYNVDATPNVSAGFLLDVAYHSILPALTIVISSMAGWMLGMRNMMLTTLSEDYVLLAEAKGLSRRRVLFAYAARNAILPNVTGFALAIGAVVGGQLLTEIVFSYPGIGYALLQAVLAEDYPLIQGGFLLVVLAVLVANFLVDLLYVAIDPRASQEG